MTLALAGLRHGPPVGAIRLLKLIGSCTGSRLNRFPPNGRSAPARRGRACGPVHVETQGRPPDTVNFASTLGARSRDRDAAFRSVTLTSSRFAGLEYAPFTEQPLQARQLPFPISPACDAHGLIADPHASVARIAVKRRVAVITPVFPLASNASATRAYKSVWLFDCYTRSETDLK